MNPGQAVLKNLWNRARGTKRANAPERLIDRPILRRQVAKLVEAVSDQIFPAGGAIPYSAQDVELTDYIIDFLGKIPADKSNMICLLMLAYEYAFPPLFLKGFRFSEMSSEKQFALLEELHDAKLYPFRILNLVVRMFITFGYMSDERVMAEMGYFKLHDYPQDSRIIQILKDLPWETKKAPSTASEASENAQDSSKNSTAIEA